MATIALVTLVRSSNGTTTPARELIDELRAVFQSAKLSKDWSIDKISILADDELVTAGQEAPRATNRP